MEKSHKSPRARRPVRPTTPPFAWIGLVIVVSVTAVLFYGLGLDWLWAWLLSVNIATFGLYAYDKSAASRAGRSRVPERTLHLFALLGGTPAAWLAQQKLRHKTTKASFRRLFRSVLALQIAMLALWVFLRMRSTH